MIREIAGKILFLLFLLLSFSLFASGKTEIVIEYQHSRRMLYNTITVKIDVNKISVKVDNMERNVMYFNFKKEIDITEEYFELIYRRFININYNEIFDNSRNIVGTDGNTISITIKTPQDKMEISLWSINYMVDERKTGDLIILLKDVFSLFDLENQIF